MIKKKEKEKTNRQKDNVRAKLRNMNHIKEYVNYVLSEKLYCYTSLFNHENKNILGEKVQFAAQFIINIKVFKF